MVITNSRLPFLADFAAADRTVAEKALQARRTRAETSAEALAAKVEQARERANKALRDTLGAAGIGALRDFRRQQRLGLKQTLQPPAGLGRDAMTVRREQKKQAAAMLRRMGVEQAKLAQIAAKHRQAMADFIAPAKAADAFHLRSNLKKWQAIALRRAGAPAWDAPLDEGDLNDPYRWFSFQPPFFGFNLNFTRASTDDFRVERLHHIDPQAGLIGQEVTLDIDDAGDYEGAWGEANTQIAFGFVPPKAGLLEVVIDAQAVDCRHELRAFDEWGWSDSQTVQTNYLTLDVLHPNTPDTSLAALSRFDKSGLDFQAEATNLILGEHYFTVLRSSGPVPANKSVVVCAGTRSHDACHSSDVEVHSRSLFRWFICAVDVRVLP
jgi:hypothetical protein